MNEITFSEQYRHYQHWKHAERTPQDFEEYAEKIDTLVQIGYFLEVSDMGCEEFRQAIKKLFDDHKYRI